MNSEVISLFDYRKAAIDPGLCFWRIGDEEIDEQLSLSADSLAQDEEADEVRIGDAVSCVGESDAHCYNRTLLLYPGSGLGEKTLQCACLGMHVGESVTVSAQKGEVKLTVTRIIRRTAPPVDDELIRRMNIEGISTVEQYRDWYRSLNEPVRRKQSRRKLAGNILREVVEKSVCNVDETEAFEWAWDQANRHYAAVIAAGIDPTVPDEGTDFLTEEQVRKQYFDQYRSLFHQFLVYAAIITETGKISLQDAVADYQTRVLAETGKTEEELLAYLGLAKMQNQAAEEEAMRIVEQYADQWLEKQEGNRIWR